MRIPISARQWILKPLTAEAVRVRIFEQHGFAVVDDDGPAISKLLNDGINSATELAGSRIVSQGQVGKEIADFVEALGREEGKFENTMKNADLTRKTVHSC